MSSAAASGSVYGSRGAYAAAAPCHSWVQTGTRCISMWEGQRQLIALNTFNISNLPVKEFHIDIQPAKPAITQSASSALSLPPSHFSEHTPSVLGGIPNQSTNMSVNVSPELTQFYTVLWMPRSTPLSKNKSVRGNKMTVATEDSEFVAGGISPDDSCDEPLILNDDLLKAELESESAACASSSSLLRMSDTCYSDQVDTKSPLETKKRISSPSDTQDSSGTSCADDSGDGDGGFADDCIGSESSVLDPQKSKRIAIRCIGSLKCREFVVRSVLLCIYITLRHMPHMNDTHA